MNERIEKLNRLALGEVLNGQDPDNDIDKMYIPAQFTKKFAELIVKDIAKTVFKHLYNQDTVAEYNEYGWDCLPGDLRTMIEKHFGAEA